MFDALIAWAQAFGLAARAFHFTLFGQIIDGVLIVAAIGILLPLLTFCAFVAAIVLLDMRGNNPTEW